MHSFFKSLRQLIKENRQYGHYFTIAPTTFAANKKSFGPRKTDEKYQ
jgi:hypothetical protein